MNPNSMTRIEDKQLRNRIQKDIEKLQALMIYAKYNKINIYI